MNAPTEKGARVFSLKDAARARDDFGPGAVEDDEIAGTPNLLVFPTDGREPKASDTDYVVKHLVPKGAIGTLVGPSGAGKTTLALDLAFHIALGWPYSGKRVKRGPVLYVGYEGLANLDNRISAAVRKHGDPAKFFAQIAVPPLLSKGEAGGKGPARIIEAARQMQAETGQWPSLIVIDTKARATAGDDENSATDVAHYVQLRIAPINEATGATVLTIHHTGKDEARKGRGSIALPAADDFTLIASALSGEKQLFVEKNRDGPDQYPLFAYDLHTVELRLDAEGDPVTANVIEARAPAATADSSNESKKPLTLPAQRGLEVLHSLYEDRARKPLASEIGFKSGDKIPDAVSFTEWRDACKAKGLSDDRKPDTERKYFKRALDGLTAAGLIQHYGDWVWLLGQQTKDGPVDFAGPLQRIRSAQGDRDSGTNRDKSGTVPSGTEGQDNRDNGTTPSRGCPPVPSCPVLEEGQKADLREDVDEEYDFDSEPQEWAGLTDEGGDDAR